MKIYLYKFSKHANSTALPISTTPKVEHDCQIKTPSSVTSPVVQLAKASNPNGYNYAYIPSFSRYYFIDEITYNLGVWQISMTTDVLGSYRSDILASSQYVLRNASTYNANILDNLYTTEASGSGNTATATATATVTNLDTQTSVGTYFNQSFSGGYFVMGVISNNSSGVTYYQMTYGGFSTFLGNMMTYLPADIDDVSDGLKKAFFDPIQYITTCYWYPVAVITSGTPVGSVSLGGYSIPAGLDPLSCIVISNRGLHLGTTVNIPKHPQATARPYTQLEPYSRYNLVFEPFGNMPLDTAKLYGASSLSLEWYIDVATGMGELYVKNGSTGALAYNTKAMLGVQVQLSQMTVDYLGAFSSSVGAVAGIMGSVTEWGAVGSVAHGIGNVINSLTPQLQTSGANGSFLSYLQGAPVLHAFYVLQVDTDPTHNGRPLCEVRALSGLSGFTLCSNAHVTYTAFPLSYEAEEIENLLNNGVYIE